MTEHRDDSATRLPNVERLYLDFDSFFASAEQHFNADLRGRSLGVVPLDSPHTSCIAVSREAKAQGVRSATPIRIANLLLARKHITVWITTVSKVRFCNDVWILSHVQRIHTFRPFLSACFAIATKTPQVR